LDYPVESCCESYRILGIADAAKKSICHLLVAESREAAGFAVAKPNLPAIGVSRWVKNADAPSETF
jgi:hypothetical protein